MKRKQIKSRDRAEMYAKMNGRCAYCGTPIELKGMQIDHVEPLYLGGKDELWNMLPACNSCNHYKGTYTLEKFRAAIERWPQVLNRDSATFRNAARFGMVQATPHKVVFYFEQKEADTCLD